MRKQTVFNPDLIRTIVDERERAIAAELRRRLLTGDRSTRWVKRPVRHSDRR